jgi:hypothetical protein
VCLAQLAVETAVRAGRGAKVAGIVWYRSAKATHHVMLATAAGERHGLNSRDGALVDRVAAAIAEASVFRG